MKENALHHDQRGIYDNAEIDGPEEIKFADWPIKTIIMKVKSSDTGWSGPRSGRTQMTEKTEQNDKDQHHAADQNIRDGFHGRMDEGRPIVKCLDLDAGRQFQSLRSSTFSRTLSRTVQRLIPRCSSTTPSTTSSRSSMPTFPRRTRDRRSPSQRPDVNRRPVLFRDHDVFDVLNAIDQAHSPHVVILGAYGQIIPPTLALLLFNAVMT